jgi:predicted histidine transporter YuiF (NhaC family)
MDESIWTAVIIIALFFTAGIAAWIGDKYRKWRRYKAKQQASQQVDGTDWLRKDKEI